MNYFITEMSFEGKMSQEHTNLRAAETWIKYLDAYHLNIFNTLTQDKKYDGTAWVIIPKGKNAVEYLIANFFNTTINLKTKFNKVYCIQEGETTFWNQYNVTTQVWIYNQFAEADKIYTQNQYDLRWLKGLFGSSQSYGLILPVVDDSVLDKSKFKPKTDTTIIAGPFIADYNGFAQTIVAKQFDNEIHIPPMASSRMPDDSLTTQDAVGVKYLDYMMWKEWMENLSQYKYGLFLVPSVGAATFSLNCAYHGIPCIGTNKAETQIKLFPKLSIDYLDLEKATELAIRLKNDQDFYNEVSNYALETIKTEFSKDKFLETVNKSF
jgi:hypothetical protein